MGRRAVLLCAVGALLTGWAAARAEDANPAVPNASSASKLEVCAACHGASGVSQMDGVPNLAGEPDLFTEWQLVYFRGETRKNDAMTPIAKDLTDDEIRTLGAYFATLPGPAPNAPDNNPELTKAGLAVAKDRHCAQCHLPTFEGQGEIPRLAGQHEEFIVKALHDYQHGARRGRGNVIMPEIAYSLNDDEIAALAHYMSLQPGKAAPP
jgi:cytochrome c553